MGNLTEHFGTDTDPNLTCPCCGQCNMDQDHMDKLEDMRVLYGKPLSIPEGGGYRCDVYDKSNSAHKDGTATDLEYPREDHFLLIKLAYMVGMTGIGDKNKKENGVPRFQLHVDSAHEIPGKRPRPWKWTY